MNEPEIETRVRLSRFYIIRTEQRVATPLNDGREWALSEDYYLVRWNPLTWIAVPFLATVVWAALAMVEAAKKWPREAGYMLRSLWTGEAL